MPVEIGDDFVHVRVADPSLFVKETFRTITIDAGQGIKATIAKRPGSNSMEKQSFMFKKDKWTIEEAKAWIAKHKSGAAGVAMAAIQRQRDHYKNARKGFGLVQMQ